MLRHRHSQKSVTRSRDTSIHSANEMKHEAHGTQQPRHIDKIGEGASTAQRSDSLVQPINQRFHKSHPYQAMILAAGRGDRMRPLTDAMPKPLLKAGDYALIEYQIMALARAGFYDVVINHAYLGEMIEQALGDGSCYGVNIRYSPEKTVLETAGGIANAMPLLTPSGDLPFLVVNADIYCAFDYAALLPAMVAMQGDPQKLVYLVLVDNPAHHADGDFALEQGQVMLDGDPKLTFSGIGIYQPPLFNDVQPGVAVKLSGLLKQAMQAGKVWGEHFQGTWIDIGTPERLAALDRQLKLQSKT